MSEEQKRIFELAGQLEETLKIVIKLIARVRCLETKVKYLEDMNGLNK